MIMLFPLESRTSCPKRFSSRQNSLDEIEQVIPFSTSPAAESQDIEIGFGNLQPFERVTDQYANLGVIFEQAIVVVPSNPVFQAHTECLVLMPLTHQKSLTIQLTACRHKVAVNLCGAKPVAMTAYDCEGNILCHACSRAYPDRQVEESLAQQRLEIVTPGIAKVMLHSQAPFTLDRLIAA